MTSFKFSPEPNTIKSFYFQIYELSSDIFFQHLFKIRDILLTQTKHNKLCDLMSGIQLFHSQLRIKTLKPSQTFQKRFHMLHQLQHY